MGLCPSKKKTRQHSDHNNKCNKFPQPPERLPIEALPERNGVDALGKAKAKAKAKAQAQAQAQARTFTYQELTLATNGFGEESFIGQGGFGCVYRGKLETGQVNLFLDQAVAVKKLELSGLQGDKEFLVEVLMLSLLRHPNLVSMIGYCAEGVQRLLVYEYMPLGCLEDHLHDLPAGVEPLSWSMRLTIAAGAARGLDYLHQGDPHPPVIYRDLKTSNILLGDGFQPKLSDFGLAKFGPTGDRSHVSTRVMGTHGYCAPEYASSGKLTMKSDIYSFGVVLLELISGKRALDDSRGRADRYLVDWARPMLGNRKRFSELADPLMLMVGRYSLSVYNKFVEVASMCVRENAATRPTSKDVVQALDYLVTLLREDRAVDSNNNSPQETIKREEAVALAEARTWGQTWRDKRSQTA